MHNNIAFSSGSFFNTINFLMEYDCAFSSKKNNQESKTQPIENNHNVEVLVMDKSFKYKYLLNNKTSIYVKNKNIPKSFIIASKTVRVDSNINPVNVCGVLCVDSNHKKYESEEILKKSVISYTFNKKPIETEDTSFSRKSIKYKFNNCLEITPTTINVDENLKKTIIKNKNNPYFLYYSNTVVVDNTKNNISNSDALHVKPAIASVIDYKPPTINNKTNGEGIKFIKLIAQKNSYSEIYLEFNLRKIIEIIGLPNGLILERNSIKGTPLISGKYPLSIRLDNNTTINALLIIPELPRQL